MGIKLWELLSKKEIEISELRDKVLAVDASPVIYQFLASIRQPDGTPLMDSQKRITSHLMGISTRVTKLMIEGIKLVFCFDGRSPDLKIHERERRELKKQFAEKKLRQAQEEGDEGSMLKYSKQTIRLSQEIIDQSKELLEALGLPIIQSISEAEAQCAYLAKQGEAWAVVSQDADTLLFGTPRLIRNLTISQKRKLSSGKIVSNKPELIDLQQTLNSFGITQDQLIAMGILIGTDYNIGGVNRVGPKTALKLVKQHPSLNELFTEVEADFNWKEIMDLFKKMPTTKEYKLQWNKPDPEKIKEILVERHEFSPERVEATIEKLQSTTKKKEQKGLGDFFK